MVGRRTESAEKPAQRVPEIVQTCPEMVVYAFSGPTGLHTGRGVLDVLNQKLIIMYTYNRFKSRPQIVSRLSSIVTPADMRVNSQDRLY